MQANDARRAAEEHADELELKNEGLEELMATLCDVKGAQKVHKWHTSIEALRLEHLRLRRQNECAHTSSRVCRRWRGARSSRWRRSRT